MPKVMGKNSAVNHQQLVLPIVGELYQMRCSPMDRSSKMKINKETQALNDTLNKMDLIDIYRTFHQKHQNTLSKVFMEHSPG